MISKYDFMIDNNGDISFLENNNNNSRLRINFYKSNYKSIAIKFDVDNDYVQEDNHMFTLKFNLSNKKYNKNLLEVTNRNYIIQRIIINLKTSLGQLPNRTDVGSRLETIYHKNIYDITVHKELEKIVSAAIGDLIDNYSIDIKPYINKDNGYTPMIKIYVYSSNELYFYYEMEW